MEETTCAEIINIIQNIKSKSSTGFHNITMHLNSTERIALPMVEIVNSMIRSGIFPDDLRIATKVMPLYKYGDVSLFTNYRPISLLSAFSKGFERLIFNCRNNFLKCGNSLSRPAGRFCIGRSSWDVVRHRPGIGYVSSKNRGIGRASCVEAMPARRRPAVSNMFDIAGRPTPARRPAGRSSETLPQKRHLQQQKFA